MVGVEAGDAAAQVVAAIGDLAIEARIKAKQISSICRLADVGGSWLGIGLRIALGLAFKGALNQELRPQ